MKKMIMLGCLIAATMNVSGMQNESKKEIKIIALEHVRQQKAIEKY